MRSFFLSLWVCGALMAGSALAMAQQAPAPPKAPPAKPGETPPQQQVTFDAVALALLIKSTIMALQHANQTGNYSVLRDLGTPVFRERFDQARLTAIFANLRGKGVNLTPIMALTPNLTKQPEFTANHELHLVGNFPSQPLQIQYELLYLQIDNVWRVEGIAVDAVPVQAVADASAQQPQQTPPQQPAANPKNGKPPPAKKPQ